MNLLRSKIIIILTWALWLFTVTRNSDNFTLIALAIASIVALFYDINHKNKTKQTISLPWFPYFIILIWILCAIKLLLIYVI
ncbi:hypothetical protein [Tannockella kyphosi]|uniref:hypothetical protein n=1 Tax=Tannockella kyphosi TaxID=2899121 RepID=UPI0020128703|nr:hypothetical protein [Tannockella kyphosi]